MLDYLIIGGGIAGLYMGLHLQEQGISFNILEKESRLGGRAWTESFAGVNVSPGAGIGRRRKDKLLMQLMKNLDIPIHFFKIQNFFSQKLSRKLSQKEVNVSELLSELFQIFESQYQPRTTFKKFASEIWGKEIRVREPVVPPIVPPTVPPTTRPAIPPTTRPIKFPSTSFRRF